MAIKIKDFFDKNTSTLTYVVNDTSSGDAVIIDPVLDYDPANGRVWGESVAKLISYLKEQQLRVHYIIETHVHADHLTGANLLKQRLPQIKTVISEQINVVQEVFQAIFNLPGFSTDGRQFDKLVKDNESFDAGTLKIKTFQTPGHTPTCVSYLIEDALFTGDSIFMPDTGTGRCDFPNGSAEKLYHSIKEKIYSLPDNTRIFVAHDYQPNGRELQFQTTVGEQKKFNIHIKADTKLDAFVQFRTDRDKGLSAPRLLLPSLQINMNAGNMPPPESNGVVYLKMPLNLKEVSSV